MATGFDSKALLHSRGELFGAEHLARAVTAVGHADPIAVFRMVANPSRMVILMLRIECFACYDQRL